MTLHCQKEVSDLVFAVYFFFCLEKNKADISTSQVPTIVAKYSELRCFKIIYCIPCKHILARAYSKLESLAAALQQHNDEDVFVTKVLIMVDPKKKRAEERILLIGKHRIYTFKPGGKVNASSFE